MVRMPQLTCATARENRATHLHPIEFALLDRKRIRSNVRTGTGIEPWRQNSLRFRMHCSQP
jgi:hypothetical protein